ncbi:MAG TPA: hypothetical protein VN515_07255 [Terriglobales bacterium]|nr:hypothetical protein [Terriglobales bacterium]
MNKNILTIALGITMGIALAATPAVAQNTDHVVVPLSHPSQPATLKVSILNGSITVKAYSGKDVVIDTSASESDSRHPRRERPAPPEAAGMHKLTSGNGLTAEEDDNTVTVHTSIFNGGSDLVIQVPENTSLNLHTVNGGFINVTGVTGDINVEDINGTITLNQVGGSIVAHGLNGKVTATVTRLDPSKPSSFSSLNGNIDVTLPADVKANVRMKTDQGDIYMDDGFNFQTSRTAPADSGGNNGQRDSNGMYRVKVDRTIYGTLNGGGPELRFENFNGNIYLRRAH